MVARWKASAICGTLHNATQFLSTHAAQLYFLGRFENALSFSPESLGQTWLAHALSSNVSFHHVSAIHLDDVSFIGIHTRSPVVDTLYVLFAPSRDAVLYLFFLFFGMQHPSLSIRHRCRKCS